MVFKTLRMNVLRVRWKKKGPPKYFDENLLGPENNEDSTVLGSIQKKKLC